MIFKNKRGFKKMKRKYFLVILFLVLAIFLSGCTGGGIVTPANDEAKIKGVLYDYCLALNDQNWSKAKSYCIYGSDSYYNVCVKEDAVQVLYQYCNVVSLTYYIDIINVDVNGNYADVYINVQSVVTACGYAENYNINQTAYLQKIGANWKLYDASEPIYN
jgi:spore coat protein CotH